jgi:predicted metallo-beta-lactamase superfamily hydrolase
MSLEFHPVWFDSMGAKSSCTLVKTPDINVLIDPGISIMQPSFPATENKKKFWFKNGEREIKKAFKNIDLVVISHYHYDHFFEDDIQCYLGKKIFIKNPNEFINDTQRKRAESFINKFSPLLNIDNKKMFLKKKKPNKYKDPFLDLKIAKKIDYKSYTNRKKELLEKGKKWFFNRVDRWNSYKQFREIESKDTSIIFADDKKFKFDDTTIRFSKPLFHGIEYSRVGWVISVILEYKDKKFLYTSDINGPIIEDYAEMIIKENPNFLILDGPMTYMFGYLLNRINLNRAIENAVNILKKIDEEVIIYDHHLPREKKFRKRTEKVWETAKNYSKNLSTAAEFLGKKTVVEQLF